MKHFSKYREVQEFKILSQGYDVQKKGHTLWIV